MAMRRLIDERSCTDKTEVERFLDDCGRATEASGVPWAGFMELVTNTRFSVLPHFDTSILRYKVFACRRCNSRVGFLVRDNIPLVAAGLADCSTAKEGKVLVVTALLPWQQRGLQDLDSLPGMQLSANVLWICCDMHLMDSAAYEENNWAGGA